MLDSAFHSHFFMAEFKIQICDNAQSLPVGFLKNLASQCQHVIRARGSKHVVQREEGVINIEFKLLLFA